MNNEPNRTIVTVQPSFIADGFEEDARQVQLADALHVDNFLYLPFDDSLEVLQQAWRDHLQFFGREFMPIVFVTSLPGEQWMEAMNELDAAAKNGDYARLVILRVNKQEAAGRTGIPLNVIDKWIGDEADTAVAHFQEEFTEEVIHNIREAIDDLKGSEE